jgi:CheY-like chemotaxis protein
LTGADFKEDEATLANLQADRVCKKPFSAPNLYSVIQQLIGKAKVSGAGGRFLHGFAT